MTAAEHSQSRVSPPTEAVQKAAEFILSFTRLESHDWHEIAIAAEERDIELTDAIDGFMLLIIEKALGYDESNTLPPRFIRQPLAPDVIVLK